MPFFHTRPTVLEAVQFLRFDSGKPVFADCPEPPDWVSIGFAKGGFSAGGMFVRTDPNPLGGMMLFIQTPIGDCHVPESHWIIIFPDSTLGTLDTPAMLDNYTLIEGPLP